MFKALVAGLLLCALVTVAFLFNATPSAQASPTPPVAIATPIDALGPLAPVVETDLAFAPSPVPAPVLYLDPEPCTSTSVPMWPACPGGVTINVACAMACQDEYASKIAAACVLYRVTKDEADKAEVACLQQAQTDYDACMAAAGSSQAAAAACVAAKSAARRACNGTHSTAMAIAVAAYNTAATKAATEFASCCANCCP